MSRPIRRCKIMSALPLFAITASVSHAQLVVPPPTCDGRRATQFITSTNQLGSGGAVYGTTGDDVIVINLPSNSFAYVKVMLDGTSKLPDGTPLPPGYPRPGGNDAVCTTEVEALRVHGGSYLRVRANTSVGAFSSVGDVYMDVQSIDADIRTGSGHDTIYLAVDHIYESGTVSTVRSGAGNDYIEINDKRTYDAGDVAVEAGSGDDTVRVQVANSSHGAFIVGGTGNDSITTGNGADLIYGSSIAYSGDTVPELGLVVEDFTSAVSVFTSIGTGTGRYITATPFFDSAGGEIDSGGGADIVHGTNGTDYLRGGSGNDSINGHDARDRLWGGSGNDKLYGDAGDDDVYGESGNDYMQGGDGADLMKGGTGKDAMHGGDGNDEMHGNEDDDEVYGNNDSDVLDGGTGDDTCSGGAGSDTLKGCNP